MATDPAGTRAFALPPDADQWPDALILLLGADADDLLRTVVGSADGALLSWRPRHVTYRPTSAVVQYTARVSWPDGRETEETLVAAMGDRIPEGATVVEADDLRVGVWRWPLDPALPGLAAALDPVRMGELLADVGLGPGRPEAARLRIRAYRPGRRAVVEVTGSVGRIFVKVVLPRKVEGIHDKHRMLAAHLPVPDSLGWTDDGLLVLPALAGHTLREALHRKGTAVPAPEALRATLDRLPPELAPSVTEAKGAGDHLARLEHYATVVAAPVPSLRGRIEALAASLTDVAVADHPVVPVHGDWYEAQLLVEGSRVVGVLDVDTAGAGHRIDDLANLIGHLSLLGAMSARYRPAARYGERVLTDADEVVDPAELRARVAAAVLALATGPFRVLEADWPTGTARRIALVEQWLERARTA